MKILIVGKDSYIGDALLNFVTKNGYDASVVDARQTLKIEQFAGYDVVVSVAGIAHIKAKKQQYYAVNKDLAVHCATLAKLANARQFIFLSTMAVYGKSGGWKCCCVDEKTPVNPKTHYAKSKYAAEKQIEKLSDNDFAVSILRPPIVIGKNCKGNFGKLIKLIKKLKFFPKINNCRSMVYIDNLCDCILDIAKNNSSGIFLPQNNDYFSVADIANAVHTAKTVKFLNIFVYALWFLPQIRKVFGSLVYDKDVSVGQYQKIDNVGSLKESI